MFKGFELSAALEPLERFERLQLIHTSVNAR
jgi:hypothetical protein